MFTSTHFHLHTQCIFHEESVNLFQKSSRVCRLFGHWEALCWAKKKGRGGKKLKNKSWKCSCVVSSAVQANALLVRLTFKESWDADNNPATSCCEETFCMVAEFFDTALVILAGVTLRKTIHTHAQRTARAINTIIYYVNTDLLVYCRIFHYYSPEIPLFQLDIQNVCLLETWLSWQKIHQVHTHLLCPFLK